MRSLRLADLAGDLRLDPEVVLAQVERAEHVGAKRLVAGLHVGERRVEEDVREQREERLPTRCQKRYARCGRPPREPRAEDDVGDAALDRLDQRGHVGRVVLHVGVLDDGDLAVDVRDRGADRGALAAVRLAR